MGVIFLLLTSALSSELLRPALESLDPAFLSAVARLAAADETGAIGRNRAGFRSVEEQAPALYLLLHSFRQSDPERSEGEESRQPTTASLKDALRAYAYGFQHQAEDGSFPPEDETSAAFLASAVLARHWISQYEPAVSTSAAAVRFRTDLESVRKQWEDLEPALQKAREWLSGRRLAFLRRHDRNPVGLLDASLALWPDEGFLEQARRLQGPGGEFSSEAGEAGPDHFPGHLLQAACVLRLEWAFLMTRDERLLRRVRDTLERAALHLKTQTRDYLASVPSGSLSSASSSVIASPAPSVIASPTPSVIASPEGAKQSPPAAWRPHAEWIAALSLWSALGPDPDSADLARQAYDAVRRQKVPGFSPEADEIRRRLLLRQIQLQRMWEDVQPSTETAARLQPLLADVTTAIQAGEYEAALSRLENLLRLLRAEQTARP